MTGTRVGRVWSALVSPPESRIHALGQQAESDDGQGDDHGTCGERPHDDGHLQGPPRRPRRPALWGRGHGVQHGVQDAVRDSVRALREPRPDDARDLGFGPHRVASRAVGRASASRAARNPRIA